MNRLTGPYPGGPSRLPDRPDTAGPPPGVDRIEAMRADRVEKRLRARRRRRVLLGLGATLLAAVVTGGWLGVGSHATAEEIAREREAVERGVDAELRRETDRVLRELWRMEELERSPGR